MARSIGIHIFVGAFAAFVCGTVQAQAGHYELVNLGTLGGVSSEGFDINIDGEIAGQSRLATGTNNHGFFWSESTGLIDVGTLGGTGSEAWGINDHGHVVGRATVLSGTWNAFLWINGSITNVYPASYRTDAIAINNDGIIVGGAETVPEGVGFVRLSNGTITLGDRWSWYTDINDPAPGSNALATGFWTHAITDVDSPIVYDTVLNTKFISPGVGFSRGINRDGTLAGNRGSLPIYAKASDGYAVHIAPRVEGYTSGRFYKINSAGLMVGYNFSISLQTIGVIYMEGAEPTNINTLLDATTSSTWRVSQIRGVNDRGYFTGTGFLGGAMRAVLLRPLDADGDGLDYYEEVYVHTTDPVVADMDGDGLSDGEEIEIGTNPVVADTDDDGTNDGDEIAMGTDPRDPASNPGNEVVFPDDNLEAAVRSAIGLPSGQITIVDLVGTGFVRLSAGYSDIVNLSGLEYCRDLTYIDLSGNGIYDIAPLAFLSQVSLLDLSSTLVTDIAPLSLMADLAVLYLDYTNLASYAAVSGLENLEQLGLSNTGITAIPDLGNLTRLTLLDLSQNALESLAPLQSLPNLAQLNLYRCGIPDVSDLSSITSLELLILTENLISDISPLATLNRLYNLHVSHNRISNLAPVSGLTRLTRLYAEYNSISNMDFVQNLVLLKRLNLSNNLISATDSVRYLTSLEALLLADNDIVSILPIGELTGLKELDLSGNRITDLSPLSALLQLESLNASKNQLSSLAPLAGLSNLNSLELQQISVGDISPLSGLTQLYLLELDRNGITDLAPLRNLTNLRYLSASVGYITDLSPLENLASLYSLNLYSNQIRDISALSNLQQLRLLTMNSNRIATIDALNSISGLGAGAYVQLERNPLSQTALCNRIPELESRGAVVYRTGSCGADADGDGLADAYEPWILTDPNLADTDGDRLDDGFEVQLGSDPRTRDTDFDGVSDGVEIYSGTNPLVQASAPADFYVDGTTGSDESGFGTRNAPWATIAKAVFEIRGTSANIATFHVAGGTYTKLDMGSGPLQMNSYEHLLGGYDATTWLRDISANPTVLDASVAASGASSHVAVRFSNVRDAVLDGFTVTGANSTGTTVSGGAGIACSSSSTGVAIRNCIITGNFSNSNGSGGIDVTSSNLRITDCIVAGNFTLGEAGGIEIGFSSRPLIERCLISGNSSQIGGAITIRGSTSSPRFVNCVISGNSAGNTNGGALLINGGTATIINSTIANNDAASGGGVARTAGTVYCINSAFSGNRNYAISDLGTGTGFYLENCLFAGNPEGDIYRYNSGVPTVYTGAAAISSGIVGSTGIVDGDPLFTETTGAWSAVTPDAGAGLLTLTDASASFDPNGLRHGLVALSTDGTIQAPILANTSTSIVISDDYLANAVVGGTYRIVDYHLEPGSAAIDMGVDTSAPEDGAVTVDFDGVARGFDGDGEGAVTADGSDYDIGAYESNTPVTSITVLAPNGGETLTRGTPAEIRWSSVGDVGASVRILIRRGTYAGTLFGSTPNDGVHTWNIPATYPIASGYTIEVVSVANPAILDASDAGFSIAGATGPAGTITVTAPNGGESYLQGATVPVTWTSTGSPGANVDILARRGAASVVLASATPNDGAFNWLVPTDQAPGTDYVIEVRSSTTPAITDSSNAPFTISAPPTLLLSAPNGGESYLPGATVPIAWSSTGAVGTIVQLLAHGAGQTFSIDDAATNDGAYDWVIPANQAPGTDYTIEVRSLSNPAIGDSSNAPFTIQASAPADSITVLSPNGGEYLLRGTTVQFRWSTTGNVGTSVKIVLRRGTYSGTLFGGAPNNGVKNWSIPANYPIASDFTIEIISVANPAIRDASDAPFSITDTAPEASITVTAPNGGESYLPGGTLPITWTSTGAVGATVQILAHGAGQTFTIDAAATNDGAFDWAIPGGQPTGTNYTIEVRSVATPAITDSSNSSFTINAAPPVDSITVVSPNGGEAFTRGSTVQFRWSTTGNVGASLKIVIRRGTFASTLFGGTPNDGVHNWTIPANYPTGSGFTIEISSVANPAIGDVSNGSFSIAAP